MRCWLYQKRVRIAARPGAGKRRSSVCASPSPPCEDDLVAHRLHLDGSFFESWRITRPLRTCTSGKGGRPHWRPARARRWAGRRACWRFATVFSALATDELEEAVRRADEPRLASDAHPAARGREMRPRLRDGDEVRSAAVSHGSERLEARARLRSPARAPRHVRRLSTSALSPPRARAAAARGRAGARRRRGTTTWAEQRVQLGAALRELARRRDLHLDVPMRCAVARLRCAAHSTTCAPVQPLRCSRKSRATSESTAPSL